MLEGELTIVEVEGFIGRAISALQAHPEGITIDCRGLTYIDAAALQALASLRIEATSRGIPILLESLSAAILNDTRLLGMSSILASGPMQVEGT